MERRRETLRLRRKKKELNDKMRERANVLERASVLLDEMRPLDALPLLRELQRGTKPQQRDAHEVALLLADALTQAGRAAGGADGDAMVMEAVQLYQQLVASPPAAPEKPSPLPHLALAQLVGGKDALEHYHAAYTLMSATAAEGAGGEEEQQLLLQQMINVLIAIAELYLTDLCFEEGAEVEAERQLAVAIDLAPNAPDAYQTLASVRLSQLRVDEALQLLEKSTSLWLPAVEAEVEEQAAPRPPLESRMALAGMAIEAGDDSLAARVLHTILEEDDTEHSPWYMLAMCHNNDGDFEGAAEYLEKAAAAIRARHQNGVHRDGDEDELAEIAQLITVVSAAAAKQQAEGE